MIILLINIDSVIPNYALHKVERYYLDRGHEVVWDMPLFASSADKIYVSCVFKENKAQKGKPQVLLFSLNEDVEFDRETAAQAVQILRARIERDIRSKYERLYALAVCP